MANANSSESLAVVRFSSVANRNQRTQMCGARVHRWKRNRGRRRRRRRGRRRRRRRRRRRPLGPAFNANRPTGQTEAAGGGGEGDGKQGTARHVKLTNRSGLAGFRIPRVIGRDPVAPSGTVVSPRSTARPVREGKGRCNPLFHARCPSAYISGAHPGPEIRFSTIPAAEDHHA